MLVFSFVTSYQADRGMFTFWSCFFW